MIRADGTCRRPITSDAAVDLNPAWATNGVVAYESDRAPSGVWIHDVELGIQRRLDTGALRASSPAFSPDGRTLAFEGRAPGVTTGGIYTVPLAGGTPVLLTPEDVPHGNGGPAFSPDGATVYFVSNRTGSYEVFKVPVAGGPAVQVTEASGILGKPAVSPDGASLAFARAAGLTTEVVLYDLGTGAGTPLGVASAADPAFDPAGGRLAVQVFHGSAANVDLVSLPATSTSPLTTGRGPDGAPAFAPLGH